MLEALLAVSTVPFFLEELTNLSPSGTITTATPTFSWTGINNYNVKYDVWLNNNNGQIWKVYELSETSIVYDGPTLISGMTYTYYVYAGSWGQSAISGNSFTYSDGLDTTGPITLITNPVDSTTVNGFISINATIDDSSTGGSGIAAAEYFIDATGPFNMSSNNGNAWAQWNTNLSADGSHTISVRGRDIFNNWGDYATVSININNGGGNDTTPPITSITKPSNGTTVVIGTIIEIEALTDDSFTGGTNIAGTEYSIDNGPFVSMVPEDGSGWNHSPIEMVNAMLNTNTLSIGQHTITVRGRDMVPNQNPGVTITIHINNPAPISGNIDTTSPGSVNRIDGHDVYLFSLAFGTTPASPDWNANCDFNGDSIIDGNDLVILAANIGKKD